MEINSRTDNLNKFIELFSYAESTLKKRLYIRKLYPVLIFLKCYHFTVFKQISKYRKRITSLYITKMQ